VRSQTSPDSSTEAVQKRQSPGLEQFFASLSGDQPVAILDLAGASQANIGFITNLGHRIYSDDIARALEESFGDGADFIANQSDPASVEKFMAATLDFHVNSFGGALLWDTLQFLAPPLLQQTLDQIYHILEPGSSMLAYFHADEKNQTIPVCAYRILDNKTVQIVPKGKRRPAQYFNNRALEKLFQRFSSVKFFLTRDHLREVIVRR
jgi:hypothetical protein